MTNDVIDISKRARQLIYELSLVEEGTLSEEKEAMYQQKVQLVLDAFDDIKIQALATVVLSEVTGQPYPLYLNDDEGDANQPEHSEDTLRETDNSDRTVGE